MGSGQAAGSCLLLSRYWGSIKSLPRKDQITEEGTDFEGTGYMSREPYLVRECKLSRDIELMGCVQWLN